MNIFIATILSFYNSLIISLYIPAFAILKDYFNCDIKAIQNTFTYFLIIFGISQIIFGYYIDLKGLKRSLYLGLILITFGSFIIITGTTVHLLTLGRIFQGIGASSISVSTRAFIIDSEKTDLNKTLSHTMIFSALLPLVIPLLGGFLSSFGWRTIFFTHILTSAILLIFFYFTVEEKQNKNKLTFHASLIEYKNLFRQNNFIGSATFILLIYFFQVTYLLNLPFIIEKETSVHGSLVGPYLMMPIIFEILSLFVIRSYPKTNDETFLKAGIFIILVATIYYSIALLLSSKNLIVTYLLPISLCIFGGGFIYLISLKKIYEKYPLNKGITAASIGITQQFGGSIIYYLVSLFSFCPAYNILFVILFIMFSISIIFIINSNFLKYEEKNV